MMKFPLYYTPLKLYHLIAHIKENSPTFQNQTNWLPLKMNQQPNSFSYYTPWLLDAPNPLPNPNWGPKEEEEEEGDEPWRIFQSMGPTWTPPIKPTCGGAGTGIGSATDTCGPPPPVCNSCTCLFKNLIYRIASSSIDAVSILVPPGTSLCKIRIRSLILSLLWRAAMLCGSSLMRTFRLFGLLIVAGSMSTGCIAAIRYIISFMAPRFSSSSCSSNSCWSVCSVLEPAWWSLWGGIERLEEGMLLICRGWL